MRLSGQLLVSAVSSTRPSRFMVGFVGTRTFLHRVKLFAAQNPVRFFGCPGHILVTTATKTQSK